MASSVIKKENIINGLNVLTPQSVQSKPFDEGKNGVVMEIKVSGVIVGYLAIRPKNFSNNQALVLYDTNWNAIWIIHGGT